MNDVAQVIVLFLQVLIFAIFARAILTWFPIDPRGPVMQALDAVTDPILDPLRRILPRLGAIDITPLVAILLLSFISSAIASS